VRSNEEVGLYNAAYSFLYSLSFVSMAVAEAFYPTLAKLSTSSPEGLRRLLLKVASLLGLLTCLGGIVVFWGAKEIIVLVYGTDYLPALVVFRILVWAVVASCLNSLLSAVIEALSHQKVVSFNRGLCVVFNTVLNLILIPRYGFVGAALTTFLTELLFVILMYYYVRKFLFNTIK
jgi:O-antigen/teichoic acid export membrane protein